MEARGFGAPVDRTWSRPSRLHRRDGVALAGAAVLITAALTVAVSTGAFRFVGG